MPRQTRNGRGAGARGAADGIGGSQAKTSTSSSSSSVATANAQAAMLKMKAESLAAKGAKGVTKKRAALGEITNVSYSQKANPRVFSTGSAFYFESLMYSTLFIDWKSKI